MAIIHTQEWVTLPPPGTSPWNYNQYANGNPSLHLNAGSPAGGNANRANFFSGTYATSQGGGRSMYSALPSNLQDYYFGHWILWSSNWIWHPVGSKIDYSFQRNTANAAGNKDNFLIMVQPTGANPQGTLTFTQQLWNAPGTQNRSVGIPNFVNNTWYWLEFHATSNSMNGSSPNQDGLIEVWINDVLRLRATNVVHSTTANNWFGDTGHSPEYGGGAHTLPLDQYILFDHSVFSTTRIGIPGGTPIDTTPPATPTGLQVS